MSFTEIQKTELQKKLNPDFVAKRSQSGRTFDYVEGWRVIEEANRVFGFDGWTRELVSLIENTQPTKNNNGNNIVSFRATVKITACGIVREGTGYGSGISSSIHDAYESAIKEAETDAMKRAMMTFGYPFGLALYDKTKSNVGFDELTKDKNDEPENVRRSKDDAARKIYAALQENIDKLETTEAADKWGKNNASYIHELPLDWENEIRNRFKEKLTELKSMKEAA